ncbi:MAG: glycosyltransferase [Actinomycetota bacterium]|nr:glycosyltransferase [Actinomycetota bacterium]
MARIVVYSMAYRGDVFPYVPVATALAERGHDVTYVVPREFHALLADEPFRCVHSGTDFGPAALDEHAAYVARWGTRLGGSMLLRLYFGVFTVPHLDVLFETIDGALAGADLLVAHPAASVVGAMAAERRGVPWLVGDLFPMLLPSEHVAVAGLPYLGRRVNRAVIRMGRSSKLDRATSAEGFRAFRRRLGLATDGWNVIDGRLSPYRNLGLVPSAYLEAQPDWPRNYRLVGFTPWEGPGGGALDDEVTAFLDAGPPPVVVTLGTSGASARPEVFDAAVTALDALGERGVFLASNTAIAARLAALAGTGHLVRPFVPLAPLLQRTRAIVHSGAHGTNALALLAGVPSVVVPCLFDQQFHAQRQQQLGTGTSVRSAGRLLGAIREVLTDDAYAGRARAFALRIGVEDGTGAMADEAETMLAGR